MLPVFSECMNFYRHLDRRDSGELFKEGYDEVMYKNSCGS